MYVLRDLNNQGMLKIERRSDGKGICEAPKDENGKYVDDLDIIRLVEETDPGSPYSMRAIIDEDLRADKIKKSRLLRLKEKNGWNNASILQRIKSRLFSSE